MAQDHGVCGRVLALAVEKEWRIQAAQHSRMRITVRNTDDRELPNLAVTVETEPGGRLVYATCSLLPEENEDRIAAFVGRHPGFARTPATADPALAKWLTADGFLRLSPRTSATDGFFVAVLERAR